jgi:microcystin-dependent protein
MWSGASAPTGWLLCDGSAVSRTTYAALFAVTSTTYGVGDGSTTFNLPDLLGRVPMGAGAGTGLTSRTLGAEVGSESTTLTSAHIPQHAHTINHGHTGSGSTSIDTQGNHTHQTNIEIAGSLTNGGIYLLESNTTPRGNYMQSAGDHSHNASTSVTVDSMTGNSGNYGTASPTAVTAVQPSTVVNFIIKH